MPYSSHKKLLKPITLIASNINYINLRLAKLDKHQQEDDINLQNIKHRFHEIQISLSGTKYKCFVSLIKLSRA